MNALLPVSKPSAPKAHASDTSMEYGLERNARQAFLNKGGQDISSNFRK
jgi:hypothetical protein